MAQGADFRSKISIEGGKEVIDLLKQLATAAEKSFDQFGKAVEKPVAPLSRLQSTLQATTQSLTSFGKGLSDVTGHATKFTSAMSNVASNILPGFKELLALGSIGGAAGFLKLFQATTQWAHDLKMSAEQLGLTSGELASIGKAAKAAGIDFDHLVTGITKFGIKLEEAADKQRTIIGDLAKDVLGAQSAVDGIQVFRGGETGDSGTTAKFIKDIPQLKDFKEVAERAYAVLRNMGQLKNLTLEQWLARVNAQLLKGADAAEKVGEDLNKLGANVPAKTLGQSIDQAMPGFKDLFAQLNVPVFDKVTGQVRKATDALGDFLDQFAKQTPTAQARIVTETMGRGFLDLIPIMQKGRAGLLQFFDAAKARGADTSAFDAEINSLDEAYKATVRLNAGIAALRKSLVVPFGDVFSPIITSFADKLTEMQPTVKAWAAGVAADLKVVAVDLQGIFAGAAPTTDFGKGVVDALNAISVAIDAVKGAFGLLVAAMQPVADILNAVTGQEYSARTYALAAALVYMTGIVPALVAALGLLSSALLLIASNPIALALTALALVGLTIYQNWNPIVALFSSVWDGMKSIGDYISSTFLGLLNSVASAWGKAKAAFGASTSAPGGVLPAPGLASGGMVAGPGGPTSDSVLARLSDGEFVMRTAAVRHWGPQFMAALNSLRNPLGGYALGGAVHARRLVPRFAAGGLVSATTADGVTVNLHFPGGSFGLRGDRGIVAGLTREARRASMLSAGRAPGMA